MKASEAKLLDFLRKSKQFVIPIYQRTYSWTERECQQLWDDILRAGGNDDIPAHFIGSIVYIEGGLYQITNPSSLLVIDGQQRLTTVALIIEALARKVDRTEPVDGFSERKLRNRYLRDPDEDGEAAHKLLLTQTDKETLLAIVNNGPLPAEYSLRLKENFEFFRKQVKGLNGNLESLCKGLAKLMVVDIALSRDQDNPQLIFESMNSTGRELGQADLIRNFILMKLELKHQEQLYQKYWRPMEVDFGQKAYANHFDGFMRHYLTVKTGEIPKKGKVYEVFKEYARGKEINTLVADLRKFASHYCAMELGQEKNPDLAAAFDDLRELKANVAYPLLLELYNDYVDNLLSVEQLEQAVRLVESYVFRRAVCDIATYSMNLTFASFGRTLKKDRYLESIQAQFHLLQSYRRFPSDREFRRAIMSRDLYNFRRGSYWLRRLENYDRKERVPVHEYTIEHIMPQNENLSLEWRRDLGDDWQRIHKDYLHTLGNLTLSGYNVEYSDRPFTEKRDMEGGYRESPLRVNEGLGGLETWNEEEIRNRADRLSSKAARVWIAPLLDAETLNSYRAKDSQRVSPYTMDDHKNRADDSSVRLILERFSKDVQNLDPCVVEDFLVHYVAYKAETNFICVQVQAKQLKLWLNLEFPELDDPLGLARDVSDIGHLGSGDVEVTLRKLEELPYVMSLVRQAFEKQMGADEVVDAG